MKTEMDFEELMDEAYGLPNGPAKLGMLEEAARVADVNGMEERHTKQDRRLWRQQHSVVIR
ncbi:hypothetical protein QF049_003371 [Paenibacillus sp. W4I10]|uniref:hypothetical protein n=1 Tax=Paenibacillus sp. W4I10 TaxID=3042298 RepID=UPI00278B38C5|nr:hypothetical protein [Paenibacillus sp. W4I10]MDQ0722110.1 hypothetical protein [Paenibacillus sp. W4I10]